VDLQPDISNLLAKSGATVRKAGDGWIVSNGARACHGDTPALAAEAFLVARQPRQREVIDRLTVIDTVVVTHEHAPKPAPDMRDVELAAARAEINFLRSCLDELQKPLPAPDALMSDWGNVGADEDAEAALTTDDLLSADNEAVADVVAKLSRQRRKRFTELLNVELAELQQSRNGPHEDRKREAKVERLLGVFARVGEM